MVAAETVDGWRLNGTAPSAGQPSAGQPGRRYTLAEGTALAQYHIWYLGPESATLTNILLTHPRNQVFATPPASPGLPAQPMTGVLTPAGMAIARCPCGGASRCPHTMQKHARPGARRLM